MEVREIPTSSAQTKEKRYVGKHAHLRRELSLAVRSGVSETVCYVVVMDDDRRSTDREFDIAACTNKNRALECEDIKVKFCGEVLSHKDKIILKYVPSKFNFADIFTKPLSTVRFRDLRTVLVHNLDGIINNSQYLQQTFTVLKDFLKISK